MTKPSKGKRKNLAPTKTLELSKLQHTSPRMILLTCGVIVFLCVMLLRHHQTSALLTNNKSKYLRSEQRSEKISLSVWLIPPKSTSDDLNKQMNQFTLDGNKGPAFLPHITIVGGISCQSEAHVLEIARTLEEGLTGFGEIPCEVISVGSQTVWNQALYFIVKRSQQLMSLCEQARELLGMDSENWAFPAPATHPHLSLFYGVDNIPHAADVQVVAPFHAYRIALWRTDPPTLEGVQYWKEISSFNIR